MFDTLWTHSLTRLALGLIALGRAYLRFNNPQRRAVGRALDAFYENAWREAAHQLGATCRSLGDGFIEIEGGGGRTCVRDNNSAIDDPVTLAVMSDKRLTYRLLGEHGIPTSAHLSFTVGRQQPAADFLKRSGVACVVKPASGTGGGRGVSTGVRTVRHLALASAHASVYGDELLIEHQVAGDNYRLLYLHGELLDAFVRRAPSVVGDGKSTVAALVKRENAGRLESGIGQSQVLLTVDPDMARTLVGQGYSLRSTPPAGKRVFLKTVVNENSGADNNNVTNSLHPNIVEAGRLAMRALDARFAGVDIITPDPSQPLEACGGVVLEVNAPPNFYYHYHQQSRVFPVAVHLLPRLLELGRTRADMSQALGMAEPISA